MIMHQPGHILEIADLTRAVDWTEPFTLRDVMIAVTDSNIPKGVLGRLIHCPNYKVFVDEAFSEDGDSRPIKEFDQLCVWITCDLSSIKRADEWAEDGTSIVVNGVLSTLMPPEGDVFALDFDSPRSMMDFPIVRNGELLLDTTPPEYKRNAFLPSVTVLDLLFALFTEFGMFGTVEGRKRTRKMLEERMKGLEKETKDHD